MEALGKSRAVCCWHLCVSRFVVLAQRGRGVRFLRHLIMVTTGRGRRRTPLAEAVQMLENATAARELCLGAKGFWLVDGSVVPSLDHVLDLSDSEAPDPRTNASIAKAAIENWPDDPSQFAVELVMVSMAHPCPCCGHLTFDEPPGSYQICPVCFWEDDAAQLRWPMMHGGANRLSLIDAQVTYEEHGAMERRFVGNVRAPQLDEPIDAGWRRIDVARDSFEAFDNPSTEWPDDLTRLYWWRPTFWRSERA